MKKQTQHLELLLKNNLKKIKSKEVAIAFSGGVDSCILAQLLKQLKIKQTAYVMGIEGCKDFQSAETAAKEIGIKLKKIEITKEDIEKNLSTQIKILNKIPNTADPVTVSYNLPLLFVSKHAKEKEIVMGQGADTLFGGFLKYEELSKEEAVRQINKDTKKLVKTGIQQHFNTAQHFNKKVIAPFLDNKIVELALSLPYEFKINKTRKYIIRKLAKQIGLSDEISFREKKSAQYGSGIMKVLKKIAKNENMTVREYIEKLSNIS